MVSLCLHDGTMIVMHCTHLVRHPLAVKWFIRPRGSVNNVFLSINTPNKINKLNFEVQLMVLVAMWRDVFVPMAIVDSRFHAHARFSSFYCRAVLVLLLVGLAADTYSRVKQSAALILKVDRSRMM